MKRLLSFVCILFIYLTFCCLLSNYTTIFIEADNTQEDKINSEDYDISYNYCSIRDIYVSNNNCFAVPIRFDIEKNNGIKDYNIVSSNFEIDNVNILDNNTIVFGLKCFEYGEYNLFINIKFLNGTVVKISLYAIYNLTLGVDP